MSAAALLAKTANPTDAEIDAAMNGNICRCATYLRIRAGIHKAATMKAADSNGASRRGSPGAEAPARLTPQGAP